MIFKLFIDLDNQTCQSNDENVSINNLSIENNNIVLEVSYLERDLIAPISGVL